MRSKPVLFLILILNLTVTVAMAQVTPENKKQAEDYVFAAEEVYNLGAKTQALEMYRLALDSDPSNVKANFNAGVCIIETINKEQSVPYFLKTYELDPDYRYNLLYLIGEAYQLSKEWDTAIEYFEKYKNKVKADKTYRGEDKTPVKDVERRIYECKNGKEFEQIPLKYAIKNIGEEVNSEFPDYAPLLNDQEHLMAFTTRRSGDLGNTSPDVDVDLYHFEDIFVARKVDGKWSPAENIGEIINTKFHDSCLGFGKDGTLYVYKDDNNGDIFYCPPTGDGKWDAPIPLSGNINSAFAEHSMAISHDDRLLFFSSDRPGGYGGLDIYVSERDKKGAWTRPRNLGQSVNTEFNDDSPYLDYDGKTLYFSSQGHKNIGGYDIFMTEYDSASKEWKEPVNLGMPINSPDDDIYFVKSKEKNRGYYATVRNDGLGEKDVFSVIIPVTYDKLNDIMKKGSTAISLNEFEEETDNQALSNVVKPVDVPKNPDPKGQNTNNNPTNTASAANPADSTKTVAANNANNPNTSASPADTVAVKPVPAKPVLKTVSVFVRIRDEQSKELVDLKVNVRDLDNVVVPVVKVGQGLYRFRVKNEEEKEYKVDLNKEGYMFRTVSIKVKPAYDKPAELRKDFEISRLYVGLVSVLHNIYYEFNSAKLKLESYNELNSLEKLLKQYPNYKVRISGHTDNIGDPRVNKYLSQLRAEAVVEFLKKKGIDSRRLVAVGYGEEKPLATNDDEREGRELNRRTEFEIIEEKKR